MLDVGKEVLNSVKASEQQQHLKQKKIFTITPEGFLKVSNEPVQKPIDKPIKIKRIVMKKNKCTPLTTMVNIKFLKSFQICELSYELNQGDKKRRSHAVYIITL